MLESFEGNGDGPAFRVHNFNDWTLSPANDATNLMQSAGEILPGPTHQRLGLFVTNGYQQFKILSVRQGLTESNTSVARN